MTLKGKKKILIFNVNWLGDVLFSTAAIRNIRYNYPESYIACIIPARCHDILEGNPHLDEIILFDERGKDKSILSKIRFTLFLKNKKFDTVFILHRSFTRALICYLAKIPERIGYYTKRRAWLLTKNINPLGLHAMHRLDYYLNIVAQSGLKIKDRFTEFYVSEKDLAYSEKFLRDNAVNNKDFLVGLNPGGNWGPKRWPAEHFATLADRLVKEFSAQIIITGGKKDLKLAKKILSLMKKKAILACGVFDLKQLGALCKRLDLFITADTGPLHIANAVGAKKIIALFGPTHPTITGPFPMNKVAIISKDVGCSIPCYKVRCRDNRCMSLITPEEVLGVVNRVVV